jgi:hypothetical protein
MFDGELRHVERAGLQRSSRGMRIESMNLHQTLGVPYEPTGENHSPVARLFTTRVFATRLFSVSYQLAKSPVMVFVISLNLLGTG